MSIRSANNKRVQNHEYTGATRRSASSAKPARAAASSVRVMPASSKARRRAAERGESLEGLSKEERKLRKQQLRVKEDRAFAAQNILLKRDDEYKAARRIFLAIMVVGVFALIVVWLMLMGIFDTLPVDLLNRVQVVGLVVAYSFVIGSFVYDFFKIRPLRNYYKAQVEGMTDRKVLEIIESAEAKDDKKSKKAATEEASPEPAPESAPRRGPKKNHRSRR